MTSGPLVMPADRLRHESIRAAAGTGKTHQLVSRYLRLIALDAKPSGILASTFTRLAAGEIRDRILDDLAGAALGEKARRELAARLGVPEVSAAQAAGLLARLAGELHLVHIQTLESFFASLVRSFAPELGLPVGAEVIDEPEAAALRREAIRFMLDERRPQPLVDVLRRLTAGANDRNVLRTIEREVAALAEVHRHAPREAWECVPALTGQMSLPQVVAAVEVLAGCNVDIAKKQWHQAWQSDLGQARAMNWRAFLRGGIAAKVAAGEATFARGTIAPNLQAAYRPLVRHARAVLVNRWRQQNLAIRDLLDRYRREEERLKRRRGVMTFADLTAALTGAESIGTLDEIAFRLDARLHHVLLDEFQDTSLMQWRALEPLVREIASVAPPERSFFCVGDAKQSIYVWRDAAPELHAALPSLLPGLAEVELSENRRSAPAIIEAVNAVFEPLSSNPALEDCRGAAADFLESFAPHTHLDENRGLAGRVEVRVVPRAAAVAQQRLTRLRAAAELVADLHRAHPHLSIGILVRTNPTVARMLHELGPGRCNTPASGRGGGPLIDAPAVNAILDLLRLADHPDDTVAAFHVAASPLGAVVGLGAFDDRAAREHVARHVRRAVLRDGLAATVARWVQALAGACEARELRRALQLVELAGPFEARRSLRSGDFAALVEQTAVADAFPAPVMVMTIHQAKGLEFDVVILPELDFKLAGQPPNVVVDRDSPIGPITRLARFAHKEIRALVPELEPMFARERVRAVRESLSLLYVAMTRAKRCLVMMIDPPKSNEQSISKQADGLLRHALVGQAAEPGSIAYECGSRDWAASIEPRDTAAVPIVAAVRPIELAASTARQRRLARAAAGADPIAPSRGAGDDAPAGADPIAPSRGAGDDAPAGRSDAAAPWDDEARDRGLALHALCEQVAWLEDGLPSEATLAAAVREAAPRRDEPWRHAVLRHFARMLRRPEIVRWFHRGERLSASLDLRREQPFARLEGDVIQSGRIDRLVGERSGRDGTGPVDRATVIDFKTDAIDRADAPASADRYRPQLEVYRRAAAELFSLDESAVDVVILFLDAGVGVPIARRSAPQASDPID